MKAKFAGKCGVCGEVTEVGQEIDLRESRWMHRRCTQVYDKSSDDLAKAAARIEDTKRGTASKAASAYRRRVKRRDA
jgi:hypothetical protein